MSDIPTPNEIQTNETGENLTKKFNENAQIGRMANKIAIERTDSGYTIPYLNPEKFPPQHLEAIKPKTDSVQPTTEDIIRAKEGSLALAVEVAAQIEEAQAPKGSTFKEDLQSLEDISTLLKRSLGFIIQIKTQNPELLIQASREAFARRQKIQPKSAKLNHEESEKWTENNFQKARKRIDEKIQAVIEYNSPISFN